MFNSLLLLSLAPVLIIAFYIYNRDRYEKEPVPLLLKALFAGSLTILPVLIIEKLLLAVYKGPEGISEAAYTAFVVAGFTEECFKFLVLWLFFWRNKNFNEKFDGIVYGVYIALGFAAVENLIYVFQGGFSVGIIRALTAVPAHALFGIMMGYNFGLARFNAKFRGLNLAGAFVIPFISHGAYDFLLMGNNLFLLLVFVPVLVLYWITGFRKMRKLSAESVFRNSVTENTEGLEANHE